MELNYILIPIFYIALGFAEGVRELAFYWVNKATGMGFPHQDKWRKRANAFIAIVICGLVWIFTGDVLLAMLYLPIRWVLLDGVLNKGRNKPFFYVGVVANTDLFLNKVAAWFKVHPTRAAGVIKSAMLTLNIAAIVFFRTNGFNLIQ